MTEIMGASLGFGQFPAAHALERQDPCQQVALRAARAIQKINTPNAEIQPLAAVVVSSEFRQAVLRVNLSIREDDSSAVTSYKVGVSLNGDQTCGVQSVAFDQVLSEAP